ncbi:PREDICTED: C3 and PZP-like alpha-2-macroglobulin domain-containing protein 8 [Papilio polytes]|uniref:C3 and PZP-like alpha-2-macroglobulin domain-containing protein 8 n=1 Tax=Papilio polytes TaxID=76194 RepID=UPI0006763000|nr:PREDICTED: C3 and PZP-like alpha-2-macroglobulin domain-containing protein 8 [Papilio polytes]
MWRCFNYTSQLSTDGVTIAAPSEAGRWSLWALSLSNRGLRFSAPRTINVFRPIQLDFSLPPALKVGETVEVDVKITNNINNCMDVTALLALSAGAAFASTGALYVTERLRLGPRGGTQLVVRVAVNTPGRKNITVEVTGYSADNCSVSYTSFNNETLVGSVIRSASVLVLPEGLHRSDTQSAYFCANEHLAVSSRGSWEWQWVAAPRNRAGLVLELRAQGAAHVALSAVKEPTEDMYRVVFERTRVWIAKGKHGYDVHLASAEQAEQRGEEECAGAGSWCAWWVWWEGARLAVGRGAAPAERSLLVWPLTPDTRINFVGFSALWGEKADFRIWNFNEEAGFSQVLELGLPHGVVPGSASGTLLVSGGLHLPLYSLLTDSADQWSGVWRDSQLSAASASLAPLLALEHIPHLVEDNEREKILKKLPEQVQILLSFRKSDNSFSDHPAMSSHLSTIKMLEILTKIQSYYPVDPNLLQSIKKWIQLRQEPDGSFAPLAADKEVDYYPVDMKKNNGSETEVNEYYYYDKDGNMTDEEIESERKVEITAETLATLLEVGIENEFDVNVAKKSQAYLEKNIYNLTSPAALAATVLALVLARSPIVPEALEILKNASTTEEGEFGWPAPRKDAADWLLEETSRNIKTTSYVLHYTILLHNIFSNFKHRALTVSLATAGMELTDTLELRAKTPPRPLQLPGLPTKVFVYATGAGCATVQGTISYSTYTPKAENALLNIQAAIIEEIHPERSSLEDLQGNLPTLIIKTCFKWKGKERSGILRLESSLFSGYELHSVNPVVLDGATFADLHYGSRGESVWFVFANISSTCPVCVTYEARSNFIITSLRPAFAKIYPSTRPDLAVETFFHARPGSPLLRGITDDDFITWFDKTEIASLTTTASIDNICECGRICSRDYEFRKQNETGHTLLNFKTNDSHAEIIEIVTVSEFKDTEQTSTQAPITTNKSTFEVTELPMTTIKPIINDSNILMTNTINNHLKHNKTSDSSRKNDSSNTNNQTLDNHLKPVIVGTNEDGNPKKLPKYYPKKEEAKKKVLTRRKGTLKATYGDKQEKFFIKSKDEITNQTHHVEIKILKKSNNSSKLYMKNEISNQKNLTEIKDVNNSTSKVNILTMDNQIKNVTNESVFSHKETTLIPHTIAAITKSNIQTMHYKTKKPKPITQIVKPRVNMKMNNTSADLEEKDKNVNIKKKPKPATVEKSVTKSLKSINKEIHKIPPTPISETSKSLAENVKPDIAPENKQGYEILDKNRLWELLKEGNEAEMAKIDDKLQINNRINVSNLTNNNRSL